MSLATNQKQFLKSLAHHLTPVVMLGNNSLTESVLEEIKNSLAHHELIKIKINEIDREQRVLIANAIVLNCQAELVQNIGKVIVIYKKNPEKSKIELPKPKKKAS